MRAPLLAVGVFLCLGGCLPSAAIATEGACANQTIRSEQHGGQVLPDCRAYELVTPPYKEGAPVQGLEGELAVSPDGDQLIGTSRGTFAGSEEGEIDSDSASRLDGTAYQFSRTPNGWQTSALGPPQSRYRDAGMYDVSADLGATLWGLGSLSQPEGLSDLYIERPRGTFVEVGPFTPEPALVNARRYTYLGASADLSHVLFSTAPGYRWPFDETVGEASTLYEYDGTGNLEPSLVGVRGGAGSTELVSQCGTLLGSSGFDGAKGSVYNAISASGDRVFFTAIGEDEDDCGGQQPPVNELLAREEESPGVMRTVAISEPAQADCAACIAAPPDGVGDAVFQGASEDGSKVFFTSSQRLLPAAEEGTVNLYEYDFQAPAGEHLALLSSGGAAAEVQGLARISEDGSHVYFVARGVLSSVANGAGALAVSGGDNLYVHERDAQFPAGRTSFIATLAADDQADWAQADERPVLASQDGRYLVFTSQADLLHEGLAPEAAQVFQYDAQTGVLVRASIGEDGYNENGRTPLYGATLATQQADAFDSPTAAAGMSAPADGAVFFASANNLTPQALSSQLDALGEPVPNVYEYRAGSVYLISDGRDDSALDGSPGVQLLGSDPSGEDAFFTTVDAPVGQDTDTQQDIYDARVEGGFPAPVPAPSCAGEACRGPFSPPPSLPAADADVRADVGAAADAAGGTARAVDRVGPAADAPDSASLGIVDFGMQALGAGDTPDTQAGGHPESLTTSFELTTTGTGASERPSEDVKDVVLNLPMGLAINAQAAPRCPLYELQLTGEETACPSASRVGELRLKLPAALSGGRAGEPVAVYDMAPEAGYPLEFGASYLGRQILMYGNVVRMGSGYGLRLAVPGVPSLGVVGASLTLFGDPAERDGATDTPRPLLTNPDDCAAGSQEATLEVDTWQHPGQYHAAETAAYADVSECDALQFQPLLRVAPETTQADEPSGYDLQIRLPQLEDPFGPAAPELKNATITLPAGVSLSPPTADGLKGCPASGVEGIDLGSGEVGAAGRDMGEPEASELGPDGLYHTAAGHCPPAASVGTVEIDTPLLAEPLAGHVYLARPECGGEAQPACSSTDAEDGSLLGLYLEAAGSGVVLKLAGRVSLNPATGQMTMRFEELSQLPISELKLHLDGGPRALLANPQACGVASTSSDLSPWSSPVTPDALPTSAFSVDWNGAGGACPGTLPFAPAFNAAVASPAAGSFSSLALRISREDRQQYLSRIGVQLPPGLVWMFSSVPLCGEPQASEGTCLSASEIGTTETAVGAGSHPLWLPGRVYLTTGYRGAPYGLSVAVPMAAGPFNLGTVIVRAAISVDPGNGALTISSDPLPQILDGIPLRIETIELDIDHPEFVLNPTICAARQITATIAGVQGASVEASKPLGTPGCQILVPFELGFAPQGQTPSPGSIVVSKPESKKPAKSKRKAKAKKKKKHGKHTDKRAKKKKGKRGGKPRRGRDRK